jgi:thioesterase domain-containing protein
MTVGEVTRYLHEHIPLTRHLGATVESYDHRSIRLAAPLDLNLNHRNTAFGGSMSALAILSGWTLLHLNLREREVVARLIIQHSTFDFREPVDGDFTATSTLPAPARWERFLVTLARHDRARVAITAVVRFGSRTGGSHEGVYVAIRSRVPPQPE